MAFRISEHVTRGEFWELRGHCVRGTLWLRGSEDPISLELFGQFEEDIRGKMIVFEAKPNVDAPGTLDDLDGGIAKELLPQLIGVAGLMTASRKRKVLPCSAEEFVRRSKLGEPPPTHWEPSLTLEWYCQHGRMLIELPMSQLDYSEEESPCASGSGPESEVEFLECEIVEDSEEEREYDTLMSSGCDEENEEGYNLLGSELQRELDLAAWRVDQEIGATRESADEIRELELMDRVLESGDGVQIGKVLDPDGDNPVTPAAEVNTEQRADRELQKVLAALAVHGISFALCEHVSLREAYRILVEKVLNEKCHPELRGTGWVQCFSAHDYCPKCQDEV